MPPDVGRVWVTRTAPFKQLTAKRLAAKGYETLLMPALRVVPVATHVPVAVPDALIFTSLNGIRSEEHTSELQSLMRISYAVFCLKKKKTTMGYAHNYTPHLTNYNKHNHNKTA